MTPAPKPIEPTDRDTIEQIAKAAAHVDELYIDALRLAAAELDGLTQQERNDLMQRWLLKLDAHRAQIRDDLESINALVLDRGKVVRLKDHAS